MTADSVFPGLSPSVVNCSCMNDTSALLKEEGFQAFPLEKSCHGGRSRAATRVPAAVATTEHDRPKTPDFQACRPRSGLLGSFPKRMGGIESSYNSTLSMT